MIRAQDVYAILNSKIKNIGGSGGSGTTDYNQMTNKPKINGVELSGNISLDTLGVLSKDSNVPVNFSIERENQNSPYVNISYGDPVERKLQLYLPFEQFDGTNCFIAKELYSFYADLGGAPTSYNMIPWSSANKIEDLNEENGPYLVLSAKNQTKEEDGSGLINLYQYVLSLKDYIPKVDETLTEEGQVADAKAVGDKIGEINETVNNVIDIVEF